MRYKRELRAHVGGFFCCVWEIVCMLNKKLHIFKGLRLFFPQCKYFYSLCEVLLSQCSVKVSVQVKIMAKSAFYFMIFHNSKA